VATRRAASNGSTSVADLYRGRARLALIRDLAMQEWSHAEIAADLGVPTSDVAAFAAEHGDEISEVRAALAGQLAIETAGLWITKKQYRLAELQADFEDTADEIAGLRSQKAANLGVGSRKHYNLNRIRLSILAAVANEIEPRRPGPKLDEPDADNVVHYVIDAPGITENLT
jgi:hypothetical protein